MFVEERKYKRKQEPYFSIQAILINCEYCERFLLHVVVLLCCTFLRREKGNMSRFWCSGTEAWMSFYFPKFSGPINN